MVHHTAPHIPFKSSDEWNAAQAQLNGTVHCDYPSWYISSLLRLFLFMVVICSLIGHTSDIFYKPKPSDGRFGLI
jgi:hypothetical protein